MPRNAILCIVTFFALAMLSGVTSADGLDAGHRGGDLLFSGVASFIFPVGAAVYPGFEYVIYGSSMTKPAAIELGVLGKAQIGFASIPRFNYGYFSFGFGAFAIARVSSRELVKRFKWLKALDFYLSVGPGINFYAYYGDAAYYLNKDTFGLTVATFDGVSLHLSELLAVKLEFAYWGKYVGPSAAVGVEYKLPRS